MKYNEYQKHALRTIKDDMKIDDIRLGIIGEFGEMTDCIKKIMYHNHNDIRYPEKYSDDKSRVRNEKN